MAEVTLTFEEFKAFNSGKAVVDYLKAKGMENPTAADQTTLEDGSICFKDKEGTQN